MSIFSIILGLIASGFAVHGAGNLKGTWNKPVESYKGSSFFSPKVKKGLDVTDKFAKTAGPALVAIQSFTGDTVKTAALQSVIDVTSGKLPKSGDKLSKTISDAGDELMTNLGSKKSTTPTLTDQTGNISSENSLTNDQLPGQTSSQNLSMIQQSSPAENIDNVKREDSSTSDIVNGDVIDEQDTSGVTQTESPPLAGNES